MFLPELLDCISLQSEQPSSLIYELSQPSQTVTRRQCISEKEVLDKKSDIPVSSTARDFQTR